MEHLAIKTKFCQKFFLFRLFWAEICRSLKTTWLDLRFITCIEPYTFLYGLTVVHCSFVKLTEVDGGWIRLVSWVNII